MSDTTQRLCTNHCQISFAFGVYFVCTVSFTRRVWIAGGRIWSASCPGPHWESLQCSPDLLARGGRAGCPIPIASPLLRSFFQWMNMMMFMMCVEENGMFLGDRWFSITVDWLKKRWWKTTTYQCTRYTSPLHVFRELYPNVSIPE